MVKVDVETLVRIDDGDPPKVTVKKSDMAKVDYTMSEPLPANGTAVIEVRAGRKEKLKLLIMQAANQKKPEDGDDAAAAAPQPAGDEPEWEPAYPALGKCSQITFKTLHTLPGGKKVFSDPIELNEDRIFTPFESDKLYTNGVEEIEAIVFDSRSDKDVDRIQVFVARGGDESANASQYSESS